MLLAFEQLQPPLDAVGLLLRLLGMPLQRDREILHRIGQLPHLAVEPKQHERCHGDREANVADEPYERVFQSMLPQQQKPPPRLASLRDRTAAIPSDIRAAAPLL